MCMVSVVIPAYNAEKTIERAINSVVNQSYDNWELIVVDDGSKDRTNEIVVSYSDSRIRYFLQKNAGPGAARNRGIDEARGEFIMFMDSDDAIHQECLKILVDMITSYEADISMCSYKKMNIDSENEKILRGILYKELEAPKIDFFTSKESICLMFYKKKIMTYPFLKLFSKSVIEGVRFPEDIRLGEDLEFNFEVFKRINKAVYTSQELYFYIDNPQSITRSLDYSVAIKHFGRLEGFLLYEDADVVKSVKNRIFVISYDFLSQRLVNMTSKELYNRCKSFIKQNKSCVLSDKNTSGKVKIMALLSYVSIPLTIAFCKVVRKTNLKKAV